MVTTRRFDQYALIVFRRMLDSGSNVFAKSLLKIDFSFFYGY